MAEALAFHSTVNASLGCLQIASLISPLSCRTFSSQYFEQRHHLVRSASASSGVPSPPPRLRAADLPAIAATWAFKIAQDHSQARILLPGSFEHDGAVWPDGTSLDGPAMDRALASNNTVVMHNMELYWRPVGELALSAMRAFGVYSQANVYFSPPGLRSAVHAHQDAQSVFIVQCEGRKRWQLFAPPQRWRLRLNQRGKAGDVAPPTELTNPIDDVTLAPGDVLFLPRGMYHRTATQLTEHAAPSPSPSLHITLGIETDTDDWTWLSLLREAAATLKLPDAQARLDAAQWTDERLRAALPLALCRPGGSFEHTEPHGVIWLAHATGLLDHHLGAHGSSTALRRALDGALRSRQDHVERKRRQLLDFVALG